MYNKDLEADLIRYSTTLDSELFNTKIYQPISNLFKWLWSRSSSRLLASDFDDVQQKTMLKLVKYMKCYKPNKGMSAVSYSRMLMSQEILLHSKQQGIHSGRVVSYDDEGWQIELEDKPDTTKTVCQYVTLLKEYRKQAPTNHRKVITAIIGTLTTKKALSLSYIDKLKHIADKSKSSIYLIKKVLAAIKEQRLYEG